MPSFSVTSVLRRRVLLASVALQPDDVISRRATPACAESDRGFARERRHDMPLTSAPSLSFAAARSDALAARRLSRVVRPSDPPTWITLVVVARVVASAAWGRRRAGVTTALPRDGSRVPPPPLQAPSRIPPRAPSESVSRTPRTASETLDDSPPPRTVVVGGGPTGLATAIMLARRGWRNIEVWERLPRPPTTTPWSGATRHRALPACRQGQIALEKLGCCDRVLTYCKRVNGRMDWSPGKPEPVQRISDKRYATQVIQRDRLVAALLEELRRSTPPPPPSTRRRARTSRGFPAAARRSRASRRACAPRWCRGWCRGWCRSRVRRSSRGGDVGAVRVGAEGALGPTR